MTGFYSCHKTDEKLLKLYLVLGDAVLKLETFVWILNHISRSVARSNEQTQHDISCGGVSLSIG